jgi:hypothetical protein
MRENQPRWQITSSIGSPSAVDDPDDDTPLVTLGAVREN